MDNLWRAQWLVDFYEWRPVVQVGGPGEVALQAGIEDAWVWPLLEMSFAD